MNNDNLFVYIIKLQNPMQISVLLAEINVYTKDGSEAPIPVKVVGCFAADGALSSCS